MAIPTETATNTLLCSLDKCVYRITGFLPEGSRRNAMGRSRGFPAGYAIAVLGRPEDPPGAGAGAGGSKGLLPCDLEGNHGR